MLKFFKNLFAGLFTPAEDSWNANSWTYCDRCRSIFFTKDLKHFEQGYRSYHLCRRCCKPETLKKFLSRCDTCKKLITDGSLTNFSPFMLCSNCLQEYTTPTSTGRANIDSDFSQSEKLSLPEYFPEAEENFSISSVRKKGQNSIYVPVLSININMSSGHSTLDISAEHCSLNISDRRTSRTMPNSKKTLRNADLILPDFSQEAKPQPKSKPIISRNNYYHPEFDDNLEDDFVLDGIGGLDDKHDS